MGMYNGPYAFEYIGALIRWVFLWLFFPDKRNQKGLFKEVLTGNVGLAKRSSKTFILNLVVGLLGVASILILILIIKSS